MSFRTALFALALASCAPAATGAGNGARTTEQEVLMMVIREHGRGAALADSTYGHGCMQRRTGCDNPGAPADAWEDYLRTSSERVALRDLLSRDAGLPFVSELGDESRLPCEQRRRKLHLSRAGLSRDGRPAVVTYGTWIPRDHLGCGATAGATLLLRRAADGSWVVNRSLGTTIS
jgi:hypothetical protein